MLNNQRALEYMEKHEIDALVAMSPENFTYVTDAHLFMSTAFAVISKEGDITVIQSLPLLLPKPLAKNTIYYGSDPATIFNLTESKKEIVRIIRNVKPEKDALNALTNMVTKGGFEDRVIGIDEAGLTMIEPDARSVWQKLEKKLPKAHLLPATSSWNEIRMVKTDEEIKRLGRAAEIAQEAAEIVIGKMEEGMGEKDVGKKLMMEAIKQETMPIVNIVSFGRNSAYADHPMTGYKVNKGDIIKINLAWEHQYYWSDICVNTVLGPSTEKHKRIFTGLAKVQEKVIDSIKPGLKAGELSNICVNALKKEGLPPRSKVGHGVGVVCIEPPYLNPMMETRLEANMVLAIESRYYEPGYGGVLFEEPVLVTNQGSKRLTTIAEDNKLR